MDRGAWLLEPGTTFLNHGSFGATPRPVLAAQDAWRARMEAQPVRFMVRELEPAVDRVRAVLGARIGADPEDLVFVPNATTAVNAVVRSLTPTFRPGDELLATTHGYNACNNVLREAAAHSGARVVFAPVPFPVAHEDDVVSSVLAAVSSRTRLALVDHVTSPTGLVLPVARIVRELAARGIDTLVDGAHAAGMLPLDLRALGATYYTSNCHKWLCAPKGAAFLHVRKDAQAIIRPAVTSHGYNRPRADRSDFLSTFDWTGTSDPTAVLAIPDAFAFLDGLLPGGLPQLQLRNRERVLRARAVLADALGVPLPAPDAMIGSLAALPLPDAAGAPPSTFPFLDPLQEHLWSAHRIEVPVVPFPAWPARLVRVSAQAYNTDDDYERLAAALTAHFFHGA